jgi:hypothetical protein
MANAAEFLARWKVRYIDAEGRILEELDTTVAECVEDANEEGFSREDLDQAAGGDLKAYVREAIAPLISDLRRLIRPGLPLPFPVNPLHLLGKYEPAGRRFFECALYPGILCSRRALFGVGRSLSVHIRTRRHIGLTPRKTAWFLKPNHAQAAPLVS